jgi:5-methylcytosine-specific restriction endonuclease McrA
MRYNASKKRVLAGATILRGVPKIDFLKLWSASNCAICTETLHDDDKSLDHKIPLSRGGDNDLANLQMAHLRCNQRKSNKIACEAA